MLVLLLFLSSLAHAVSSFEIDGGLQRHHVTADRTLFHSKEKIYEAFGHVVISAKGQRLSADYAWIDTNTKELKAKGNAVFVNRTNTVQAAEIHYNIDTGLGSIFYGTVYSDLYTLRGQLIRKIDDNRFLTTEGEYTTCKDCAESWKLAAKNIDFTVEGYAHLSSVFVKIKDMPALYLPYLVVPVKTKRQTGLLFPRVSANSNKGFIYVQPLFVALGPHQDMTLSFGKYSRLGYRYELEHRYKLANGVEGRFQFFRTNDRQFDSQYQMGDKRTAILTTHNWPVTKNLGFKWRVFEVRDREYIRDFPDDINRDGEPAMESNGIGRLGFENFFLSTEAKRYRNLLYDQVVGTDGGVVQPLPTVYFGLKEQKVGDYVLFNISSRFDEFLRRNGPFFDANNNHIYEPNTDNIREATRLHISPEISAPFRVGKFLSLIPSMQYNETQYFFHLPDQTQKLRTTSTQYALAKLEASTVLERVYDYDGKKVSKVQHQVMPFLTYSRIPWKEDDPSHPFKAQLKRDNGAFDQYDIVPISNSTNFRRLPLGNSVYYGFSSRVVRKLKKFEDEPRGYPYDLQKKPEKVYPLPRNRKQELEIESQKLWDVSRPDYSRYQEVWNFSVSQAFDFIEAKNQSRQPVPDTKRAFSYLYAKSFLGIDEFTNSIEYKFFPRIVRDSAILGNPPDVYGNRHSFTTSFNWVIRSMRNLRNTRSFVRTVGLTYSNVSAPDLSRNIGADLQWSINDFVGFQTSYSYDFLAQHSLKYGVRALFTHPSECWRVGMRYDWRRDAKPEFGIDMSINLMGTGFVGVNQFGNNSQPSGPAVFGGS